MQLAAPTGAPPVSASGAKRWARLITSSLALIALLLMHPGWGAAPPVHSVAGDGGDIHVHDPMMIQQGSTSFIFATVGGLSIRTSTGGMTSWSYDGTVCTSIPSWVSDKIGALSHLWAPDASYFVCFACLYYKTGQRSSDATATAENGERRRWRENERGACLHWRASVLDWRW